MFRPFYSKSIIALAIVLSGCKAVSITQDTYTATHQAMALGLIGEDKQFLLEQDYNHTAIPNFTQPVKVQIITHKFNKPLYNAFAKANTQSVTPINTKASDSTFTDSQFLQVEIADRVTVISDLNGSDNRDVKDYIVNKDDAHIITSLSVVFPSDIMTGLQRADEVFLEPDGVKSYALQTYQDGQPQLKIRFNKGVVFAYQASGFCWKENDKYQLEIVDIVEDSDQCPKRTYKNAKRAKKKINYYKF